MADIKWIKITTDIFDDEKILLIESLPDADSIIVIWFKLLCLAGKQNNSGVFLLNDKIPYTDKMLATIFRRKESAVQLALKTFEDFGMIEIIDGVITIPKWDKHQNVETLDDVREKTRLRVARHRERQKQLLSAELGCNATCNATVTPCNAQEGEKEEEKEYIYNSSDFSAEKSVGKEKKSPNPMPKFQEFVDLYHQLCPSLPKVQKLTEGRKSAIKARWLEYPDIETFKEVFRKCESNTFMKGGGDRGWVANFDFIFQASSFTKIIEGFYDMMGKPTVTQAQTPKKPLLEGSSFDTTDFYAAALKRTSGGK